jgi:hypothetical protein
MYDEDNHPAEPQAVALDPKEINDGMAETD